MKSTADPQIHFQELDAMEAPNWESFYTGVLTAMGFILMGAVAAT